MLSLIAGALMIIWLAAVLFGKGGAIHMIALFAVALFVSELAAKRRAAQ